MPLPPVIQYEDMTNSRCVHPNQSMPQAYLSCLNKVPLHLVHLLARYKNNSAPYDAVRYRNY
jgi:hypothetical protein